MKLNLGKLELEAVTGRHRSACVDCGEVPEISRLKITKGSGRWQKVTVYCRRCGWDKLRNVQAEIQDIQNVLEPSSG